MKFIVTKELGKLAKWLRLLGFDTEYFTQNKYSALIIQALKDDRVLVTRSRRISAHTGIRKVSINSDGFSSQLKELLNALRIEVDKDIMFSRCVVCNKALVPIEKAKVKDKVPEYVFNTQDKFTVCEICRRLYWQGTHWGNIIKALEDIRTGV